MISIFIPYNNKIFFLSHVFEHFLEGELRFYKFQPIKAHIGNGIIYFKLNKKIKLGRFLEILKDFKLKEGYYNKVCNTVIVETKKNIKTKLSFECSHHNVKDKASLLKILKTKPNQNLFEEYVEDIIKKQNYLIVDDVNNKILFNKAKEYIGKNPINHILKNGDYYEFSYKTNAKNVIDGLIYFYICSKLPYRNYVWLNSKKELIITFVSKNEKFKSKLNGKIFNLKNLKDTHYDEIFEQCWQIVDWGMYIRPQEIQKKLNRIKKVKLIFNKKNVVLRY